MFRRDNLPYKPNRPDGKNWHLDLRPGDPDFLIGGEERPYMQRWYLIRTPWFSINLHKFLRDDDDRALHDHPWWSFSFILEGGYFEVTGDPDPAYGPFKAKWYSRWSIIGPRAASKAHRVALAKNPLDGKPVPCWSLFIYGPVSRRWGFHCPKGWKFWKDFCSTDDVGVAGAGCE